MPSNPFRLSREPWHPFGGVGEYPCSGLSERVSPLCPRGYGDLDALDRRGPTWVRTSSFPCPIGTGTETSFRGFESTDSVSFSLRKLRRHRPPALVAELRHIEVAHTARGTGSIGNRARPEPSSCNDQASTHDQHHEPQQAVSNPGEIVGSHDPTGEGRAVQHKDSGEAEEKETDNEENDALNQVRVSRLGGRLENLRGFHTPRYASCRECVSPASQRTG